MKDILESIKDGIRGFFSKDTLEKIRGFFTKELLIRVLVVLLIFAIIAGVYGIAVAVRYNKLKNDVPITDEELQARLAELLPKADVVNQAIWGAGLEWEEDGAQTLNSVTGGDYRPVKPDAPFQSVAELKSAVAEVYSSKYIKSTINYLIDGQANEEENTAIASSNAPGRYIDKKVVREDGTSVIRLNVDISNPGFNLTGKIDPASAKSKGWVIEWTGVWYKADRIAVEVTQTYTVGDETGERTLTLYMVKENGVWLLDSPSY